MCRAPKQTTDTGVTKKKSQRGTNWIDTGQQEKDSDTDSELPLFKIRDSSKAAHPITVDIEINGRALNMEVDTGAAFSLFPRLLTRNCFLKYQLSLHPYILEHTQVNQ